MKCMFKVQLFEMIIDHFKTDEDIKYLKCFKYHSKILNACLR